MSEVRERLSKEIDKYNKPKYTTVFFLDQIEIWVNKEDTDALEVELSAPPSNGLDVAADIRKNGLRSWPCLFGYPVRWDMPTTEVVIVG